MENVFFLYLSFIFFRYLGLSWSIPRSTQLDTQFMLIELQGMNLQ